MKFRHEYLCLSACDIRTTHRLWLGEALNDNQTLQDLVKLADFDFEGARADHRAFSGFPGVQGEVCPAKFLFQEGCSHTAAGTGWSPGIESMV